MDYKTVEKDIMTEIIPVIHLRNQYQMFQSLDACLANDVEKVFIINHETSAAALLSHAYKAKYVHPDLWVGVNFLGKTLEKVTTVDFKNLDGVWHDSTMTESVAQKRTFKGMLFTGVAFKYQPQPTDLKAACEQAKNLTDVVTTSGEGTGKETPLEKVKQMREYLGDHPLAIASGVNVNNIEGYKGIVDYILVASSITDTNEITDFYKLRELKSAL